MYRHDKLSIAVSLVQRGLNLYYEGLDQLTSERRGYIQPTRGGLVVIIRQE
jgi:hypothetical protein